MAPRKHKIEHKFVIFKEPIPGSAYLLLQTRDLPADSMDIDLGYLSTLATASAWSSLANAKKQAALSVNRKFLTWTEDEEKNVKVWKATYIEKVDL
jgi:hypothetical protein